MREKMEWGEIPELWRIRSPLFRAAAPGDLFVEYWLCCELSVRPSISTSNSFLITFLNYVPQIVLIGMRL